MDALVEAPAPDVLVLRVVDLVGGEDDLVVASRDDRAHLQILWLGDGLAVEQQTASALPISAGDQDPLIGASRSAAHQLDPDVVVVMEQLGGVTGVGIDGQHGDVALVAGLHRYERAVAIPAARRKVGERSSLPCHLDAVAVKAHDPRRHLGVGRARRGVGDLVRWLVGMGWVGDPPPLHRRRVDPRGEKRIAVMPPPVAALTVHLLGCDELGQTPADERVLLARKASRARRIVELSHPELTSPDPRDARACRVGTRIEHRSRHVYQLSGGGLDIGYDEAAVECGHSDAAGCIGGIGDDPPSGLPGPFAAGAFLRRQVGVGIIQQTPWVGDHDLGAAGHVESPERVHRVVGPTRPEERDPRATRRHLHVARRTQREALGAGVETGERLGQVGHWCILHWIRATERQGADPDPATEPPGGGAIAAACVAGERNSTACVAGERQLLRAGAGSGRRRGARRRSGRWPVGAARPGWG